MNRYQTMFEKLKPGNQGAFIPFVVLGDPDPETSYRIIAGLIESGADALELGFPFSDPVADGPVIQRAGRRALDAGITQKDCFGIVARVRSKHPDIPIGLLVYANLVMAKGLDRFFASAARSGADSVLIADLPSREAGPFRKAANKAGIALVLVLPVYAAKDTLESIARASQGYLYLLSRKGVTGAAGGVQMPSPALIDKLETLGAAPAVLGFGIAKPEQVASALNCGCRGVISGSAVVGKIEACVNGTGTLDEIFAFAATLKAATVCAQEIPCPDKQFGT